MADSEIIKQALEEIWSTPAYDDSPAVYRDELQALDVTQYLGSTRRFGTPQYLLEADKLRRRAQQFSSTMRAKIPAADCFYALKCNDLPALVAELKAAGFQADVAGLFELQLALKLGFERIIFTGPGKTSEELELAVRNAGRVVINIDNQAEIERLREVLKRIKPPAKVPVSFRLNPETAATGVWHKFGFKLSELGAAVADADAIEGLQVSGLHCHSSWNSQPERYAANVRAIGEYLAHSLPELVGRLKFLDLGGGFYPERAGVLNQYSLKGDIIKALKYHFAGKSKAPDFDFDPFSFALEKVEPLEIFAEAVARALNEFVLPLNPALRIWFEPGRFIAFHSTSILLEVMALKDGCAIVNGGINLLGDYRFEEQFFAPIYNLSRPSTELKRCTIYGPLCDPYDLWGYSYFGDGLQEGDKLAVLHQGAYTFSCAWRFIRPVAPYVMLSAGELKLVKGVETFEQRYAGCGLD